MARSNPTFATLLRDCRRAAGLSQEALAERAQLSVQSIAAFERGRRTAPYPATLKLLTEALGLTGEQRAAFIAAATTTKAVRTAGEQMRGTQMRGTQMPGTQIAGEQMPGTHVARSQMAHSPAEKMHSATAAKPLYTSLPVPPTTLVGRERDEAALTHLLHSSHHRLITLLGPGGVGKTRLALAVGANSQDSYADGVVFVDLSAVREHELVARTIAQAMGLQEAGRHETHSLLFSFLRTKTLLLILDNFEQVLDASSLVNDLLVGCPGLTILATSRTALQLRAEQRYRVPPLTTPGPGRHITVEEIASCAAIQLFVARARAVQPEFALTMHNARAVSEICRQLDGLPLALELAAARVAVLPPETLQARLAQRLRVLRGGPRDLPDRQQTMRATIDWSYNLLTADEQVLLARLSIFVGGCTLDAAEAICSPDGVIDVVDASSSLLDKSLLVRIDDREAPRLGMLETVREYAWERLMASGEMDLLQHNHARYFLALAESTQSERTGPPQRRALDTMEREHDNVRAILRWSRHQSAPEPPARQTTHASAQTTSPRTSSPGHGRPGFGHQHTPTNSVEAHHQHTAANSVEAQQQTQRRELGLRLAALMLRLWLLHGHMTEGRRWLDELLAESGSVTPFVRAEALRVAAMLAIEQGDMERSEELASEAANPFRAVGHASRVADMANLRGNIARERGDYTRATTLYEECLTFFRGANDVLGMAIALSNLGTTARYQGDLGKALTLFEESLALRRPLNDPRGLAFTLSSMGETARRLGDRQRALAAYQESLALSRDLGDRQGSARVLCALGTLARQNGDLEQATSLFMESVTLSREIDAPTVVASGLEGLAGVALDRGRSSQAVRLFGAAATQRLTIGGLAIPLEHDEYDHDINAARTALGLTLFEAELAAGGTLSVDEAMQEARQTLSHLRATSIAEPGERG